MEYLYCKNDNFEDFASGRVIYGGKGIPNFPVRLLLEIYGRAKSYSEKKDELVIYDPCCGGGYALTVLGFFHNKDIYKLYGSDIDEDMVTYARKNLGLLSEEGLSCRWEEIQSLLDEYGKASHKEALNSCAKLSSMLEKQVETEVFQADCTGELPNIQPDIIITDVPYGNLVEWNDGDQVSLNNMLESLWKISHEQSILAVCMDKKQKIRYDKWKRLEKQTIGKRKFEILMKIAE